MLTKNFYAYIRADFSESNTAATFTKTDGSKNRFALDGDSPPFKVMNNWAKSTTEVGVSFGTGTTPATASDYALESILGDTQISVAAPNAVSYSQADTYEEYSVTFGITNKTTEAITISEVGLTAAPVIGNPDKYALVDRTVLDTPITIPAGQSKQITYTIRFNYGDAV